MGIYLPRTYTSSLTKCIRYFFAFACWYVNASDKMYGPLYKQIITHCIRNQLFPLFFCCASIVYRFHSCLTLMHSFIAFVGAIRLYFWSFASVCLPNQMIKLQIADLMLLPIKCQLIIELHLHTIIVQLSVWHKWNCYLMINSLNWTWAPCFKFRD